MKPSLLLPISMLLLLFSCKKGETGKGDPAVTQYEVKTYYSNTTGIIMSGMYGICAVENATGLDYLLVVDPVTQIVYKITGPDKAEIFVELPSPQNNLVWDITTDGANHFITTGGSGIIKTDYTKNLQYLSGYNQSGTAVEGPPESVRFRDPRGICYSGGAVYITDMETHLVQQVSAQTGYCNLFAGRVGVSGGNEDGDQGTARFIAPMSICENPKGGFFVGQEAAIRKISNGFVKISTLAGGSLGYRDGQGTAAAFDMVTGMCADKDGNLYVADYSNCCIRKIDEEGNVTTFAGLGDDCGYADGDTNEAKFYFPYDICLDSKGNFYVTDHGNKKIRIIKPK
ncbi:MAG: hypothetical protein QM664_02810, partial [Flavihumibacter sp.]